jgi:hypothetical protein
MNDENMPRAQKLRIIDRLAFEVKLSKFREASNDLFYDESGCLNAPDDYVRDVLSGLHEIAMGYFALRDEEDEEFERQKSNDLS